MGQEARKEDRPRDSWEGKGTLFVASSKKEDCAFSINTRQTRHDGYRCGEKGGEEKTKNKLTNLSFEIRWIRKRELFISYLSRKGRLLYKRALENKERKGKKNR